ncbi:insulinase family protein [Shewanella donghaensis]|uniref:insulinase family protein n=1 Tax=Shewanella donghaensis TaxID=238836 RepID=UPI0013156827|nr:insulinase family protein [Shewanella donghaensis]
MLIWAQLGCQHAPIKFTPSAPPNLPSFTALPLAPKVAPLKANAMQAPQTTQLTENSFLHQWPLNENNHNQQPDQQANSLYFIGISKSTPIANPDILVAAFKQHRKAITNNEDLTNLEASCYDSMRFRASLHSIGITISCFAPTAVKSNLLWQFWDKGVLDEVNIDSIQRSLKLNKHIGAFTGAEIDTVFRKKLLGEQHPYNQNIDNNAIINELNKAKLSTLHLQIRSQMQWHLFTPQQASLAAHADVEKAQPANFFPSWLTEYSPNSSLSTEKRFNNQQSNAEEANAEEFGSYEANSYKASSEKAKTEKTLYLIDAPNTVQTQVRVGVLTESSGYQSQNANSCKIIAALLGRGYSGRLFYDLRETRGLTYGVYGGCVDAPLSQYMYFYGSTALANSGAFLKGMTDHLALISEQLTPQQEINSAATYLIGKQQLTIDRPFGKESLYINQILRNKALKNKQPLAQQLKNQALENQASAEFDQGLMQLSKLTPQELLVMTQTATLNDPVIVLRGDADKITIDLQQKFPTWQIKLVEVN